MPKKKKPDQVFIVEPERTNTVKIHVTGDMMPNAVFLKILEHLKTYRAENTIAFVVYNINMMRLIGESIPSEYYNHIEISGPGAHPQEGALEHAG